MTVHGAKGLQAPIVFLPDTTNTPSLDDMLYWTDQNNAFLASPFSDITHEGLSVLKEDAKALMMAEYYRLLYVAMTRAEDELYIAGWQTGKSIKPECWYHLACEALKPIAKEHDKRWILENEQAIYNIITPDEEAKNILPFPEYLTNPAPQEGTLDKPLSPSKLEEADYTPQAINPPSFQRGTLIHTLLELLPNSPAAEWQMRCEQYLEQSENITTETKNEITTEVLALLNNPDFKPLFTETSYAEVPITGKITLDGKPIVISGQIDRLVITNDVVWVIDYKTHQSPPKNLQDTPSSYITQLRAYAALLKEIYPQHQIKAALLWTTIPKLMPVPLDACAA
jgi:ATP-dependent helicase/nuclease subunit A